MSEEVEVVAIPAEGLDAEHVLSPFDLDIDDAAVIYLIASVVAGRLGDEGYTDKPYSAPLPRGFIKAGEAVLLVPALMALVLERHPTLLDTEVLQASLMSASLRHKKGKVN